MGNCTDLSDDTMFPDEDNAAGVADALYMCEGCPIRIACLAGALTRGEEFGVWGGTTSAQRIRLIDQLAKDVQSDA